MNFVDLILIIIILFSMWIAWEKGFINACLDLIVWGLSLLAGFLFYAQVSLLLSKIITTFAWILPLSFMLVVIVSGILISILTRLIAKNIPAHFYCSKTNRYLSIIPGFVNGCVSAVVVTLLLLSAPLGDRVFSLAKNSALVARFTPASEWIQEQISPVFYDVGRHNMARLSTEAGLEKTVKLPFTKKNPYTREDLEIKMLQLVNAERSKEGLQPLALDTAMTRLARAYSKQMFARGFFSHYTPEKESPFDRMKKANIRYITAGENLALAHTLIMAHNGLMNSPGHRANILNPAFGRLGIGIVDGGIYGLMISQEFRN